MKLKRLTRSCAVLLSVLVIFTMMPMSVFADDASTSGEAQSTETVTIIEDNTSSVDEVNTQETLSEDEDITAEEESDDVFSDENSDKDIAGVLDEKGQTESDAEDSTGSSEDVSEEESEVEETTTLSEPATEITEEISDQEQADTDTKTDVGEIDDDKAENALKNTLKKAPTRDGTDDTQEEENATVEVKNTSGNTTYYESLSAAITAVNEGDGGDTVTMLADSDEGSVDSSGIEITKSMKLDLAGHTVTGSSRNATIIVNDGAELTLIDSAEGGVLYNESTASAYTIDVKSGATLNIKGGTINGYNTRTIFSYGTINMSGGKVLSAKNTMAIEVLGGELNVTDGTITGGVQGIWAVYSASVNISGGTITNTSYDSYLMQECAAILKQNSGNLNITGGTLEGKRFGVAATGGNVTISGDAAIKGTGGSLWVGSNYKDTFAINGGHFGDGVGNGDEFVRLNGMTLKLGADSDYEDLYSLDAAAENVTTGLSYGSLTAAIEAAGEGDTVAPLRDIELAESITISADKSITLDLKGHTLSYPEGTAIINNGTLTVKGASLSTDPNGTISGMNAIQVGSDASLTIKSGIFRATEDDVIVADEAGSVSAECGTFSSFIPEDYWANGCVCVKLDDDYRVDYLSMTSGGSENYVQGYLNHGNIFVAKLVGNDGVVFWPSSKQNVDDEALLRALIADQQIEIKSSDPIEARDNIPVSVSLTKTSASAAAVVYDAKIVVDGEKLVSDEDYIVPNSVLTSDASFDLTLDVSELSAVGIAEGDTVAVTHTSEGFEDETFTPAATVDEEKLTVQVTVSHFSTLTATVDNPVASVGDGENTVFYSSLAAAIAVASSDDTIKLLVDIEVDEGIDIIKTTKIDLAGHTIDSTVPKLFTVQPTGFLTITGNGTINGPENGKEFDGEAVITVNDGLLEYKDGTLNATGEGSEGMYGVYVKSGTARFGVAADEEAGTEAQTPTINSPVAAIGIADDADLDTITSVDDTLALPAAYMWEAVSGSEPVTYKVAEAVASVTTADGATTTKFTTLQAAINAAQAGDTVTLLRDAEENNVAVASGHAAFTLDLGGHTLSWPEASVSLLNINNSEPILVKNGTIARTSERAARVIYLGPSAQVTFEDVTIESTGSGIGYASGSGADVVFGKGTNIQTAGIAVSASTTRNATVTVEEGATITSTGSYAISAADTARATAINIEGGTITAGGEAAINVQDSATLAITGGAITNTSDTGSTIKTGGSATATISDGVFTSTGASLVNEGGAFTINGGYFSDTVGNGDEFTRADNQVLLKVVGGDYNGYYTLAEPVASIGDNLYASVNDAKNAAESGDTITLLNDTEEYVYFGWDETNKNLILDLNGHEIARSGDGEDGWTTLFVADGQELTIVDNSDAKTGKVSNTFTGESQINCAVYADGTVNVEGGIISCEAGYGIYNNDGTVAIRGGAITGAHAKSIYNNVANTECFTITGAAFSDDEGNGERYVRPEGKVLVKDTDSESETYGFFILTPETEVVAKNERTGELFTSLQAAFDAAADGDTITVLKDIKFTGSAENASFAGKAVTLDLNGCTVSNTAQFGNGVINVNKDATLTLTDSSDNQDGAIVGTTYGIRVTSADIIVNAGAITATTGNAIALGVNSVQTDSSTATVNGGVVEGANSGISTNNTASFDIVLNGGEVKGGSEVIGLGTSSGYNPDPQRVTVNEDAKLTGTGEDTVGIGLSFANTGGTSVIDIKGGSINVAGDGIAYTDATFRNGTVNVTVSGGTIDAGGTAIKLDNDGNTKTTATIEGGVITGETASVATSADASFTINGGYFSDAIGNGEEFTRADDKVLLKVIGGDYDGMYTLGEAVCSIGDNLYASVNDAKNSGDTSADTIKLLKDTTEYVYVDKDAKIDLNGHTLTAPGWTALFVASDKTLTLLDSSEEKTGRVVNPNEKTSDNQSAIYAVQSKVTVDGGTIECTNGNAIRARDYTARVTINDGTIIGAAGESIYSSQSGTITINGGAFSDAEGNAAKYNRADNQTLIEDPDGFYRLGYTIAYELPEGAENSADNPAAYHKGDEVELADPTWVNHDFQGWFSDAGYETAKTGIAATDTGNFTFYAKFGPDKTKLKELVDVVPEPDEVKESTDGKDVDKGAWWATEADKKAFVDALDKAQNVLDDKDASQDEVDNALAKLKDAYEKLKKATIDKTDLQKAVDKAIDPENIKESTDGKDVPADDNWATAEDKTSYENALARAKDALENATKQQDVDNALAELNAVASKIKQASTDKKALEDAVKNAKDPEKIATSADGKDVPAGDDYMTEADKAAYEKALEDAKKVLEDPKATQNDVDAAVKAIEDAATKIKQASTDKKALEDAVKNATDDKNNTNVSKDGGDVDPKDKWVDQKTKDALDKAIEDAKKVADNPKASQKEIDAATKAVNDAEKAFDNAKKSGKKVTGVKLDKTSVTATAGDSVTLKATVSPADAVEKGVTWTSSDTSVATVDANGTVTTKKAGTVTITATTKSGNKKATCKVTVKAKEKPKPSKVAVTGLKITPNKAELATKKTLQMKVTVTPSNATNKAVTWKSSDPSVAKVDANGKVTAIKYGKPVTITATSKDNGKIVAKATIQTRFYDVNDKANQYYWTPVYWAADKEITKGYTDNKSVASDSVYFGPQRNCTRKEMVIFLWRLAGKPSAKGSLSFSDTKNMNKNSDGYKAVLWATTNGIVKGYTTGEYKGQFRLDDPVARKDTLIMLYRMAKKPSVSGKVTFPDVLSMNLKTTSDTYKAILWGTKLGITKGYVNGKYKGMFRPMDNCLREHIVTFIYRYAQKVK